MELDTEQIKILAELERNMDLGKQPYVIRNRLRYAVSPGIMTELALENGQTVNHTTMMHILQLSISTLKAQIAIDKARRK